MDIPILSVVGKSGSGKTTLICGLIGELKRRGFKVAAIKHGAHGFNLDQPGKDSWKHAEAGADTVVVSSPEKVAMIEKVQIELTLDQVIAKIKDVDIIISEGYKGNDKPKLEVFRSTVHHRPLCTEEDNLIAMASDIQPPLNVPLFQLSDFTGMVNLIENKFLRNKGYKRTSVE